MIGIERFTDVIGKTVMSSKNVSYRFPITTDLSHLRWLYANPEKHAASLALRGRRRKTRRKTETHPKAFAPSLGLRNNVIQR